MRHRLTEETMQREKTERCGRVKMLYIYLCRKCGHETEWTTATWMRCPKCKGRSSDKS